MSDDEQPITTRQVDVTLTEDGALEVTGDTLWSGRWVRDEPTQAAPAGRDRIEGARCYCATRGANGHPAHTEPTGLVPEGWDRIEAGTEDDQDDVPDPGADADRELERMELGNDRARIDLEREKLAHSRLVASDDLRVEALRAARSIVGDYKYADPIEHASHLEAQYRRILGLLEEPDPANGPQLSDEASAGNGEVRVRDTAEQPV